MGFPPAESRDLNVCLARMHDQRQSAGLGGRDMRPEHLRLNVVRAVIVVKIETGLAYANHPRVFGKRGQLTGRRARMFARFVRMNPNRAPHVVVFSAMARTAGN